MAKVIDAYVGQRRGKTVIVLRFEKDTSNHLVDLLKFWSLVKWSPPRALQQACKELIGQEVEL